MTRVVAPSRLHFGLIHVPADATAPGRRFGGCGLMIDAPGVAVSVTPANEWCGEGPSAERAVGFAKMVTPEPHRVVVERCPAEHVGLGVGTSLGLAVAKALRPDLAAHELAPLVGRGLRSGIGLHGFERGGFIADAGKPDAASLPALAGRYSFPADWRVVVIVPDQPPRWRGPAERAAFARSRPADVMTRTAERMDDLLHGQIVPALTSASFDAFGDALFEYNRLAGEAFAEDQGGTYAGPLVAELVAALHGLGVRGVGQSSWGPAVFAVCEDVRRAESLAGQVRTRFAGAAVTVTAASTGGAVVTRG